MDSESTTMSFQKVVLIVAIIALILTLSVIGYMMYYTEQNKPHPPTDGISQCPDGWTGSGGFCHNTISNSKKNNIGNFILEHRYCVLTGSTSSNSSCPNYTHPTMSDFTINGYAGCTGPYVLGNVSNGLPSTRCYLLASGYIGSEIDISHNITTLDKDVSWAKKYGITWDGFN
jgi:hypothetical protein